MAKTSNKTANVFARVDPRDLAKACALGFECVGYPDEVVKYISEEEYAALDKQAEQP